MLDGGTRCQPAPAQRCEEEDGSRPLDTRPTTTQPAKLFTTATTYFIIVCKEVLLKFTLCFSLVELVKDWRKVVWKFKAGR